LLDAWLKIKRAKKHLADFEVAFHALQDSYRSSIEKDPASGGESIKHESTEAEDIIKYDLALICGDCIHNLKTALDHAWTYVLTRIDPALVDDHTKFPIRPTLQELKAALKGKKIDVSCPRIFKFITSQIKAYEAGNYDLWTLHQLDIADKHRLLLPLVQAAWIDNYAVKNKAGEIVTGGTWLNRRSGPYHVDFSPGYEVQNHGKLSLLILFDKGVIAESDEILDALTRFSRLVSQIVVDLEHVMSQ
jgi:hypothetical protein